MTDLPTTPSFRLDGRRALVTGASGGIGEAAAIALAEAGAEVLLTARRLAPMQQTTSALQARGLAAQALALDVTDRAATRAAIAAHGPFDILVNNAGTIVREPVLDVTDDAFDAMVDLNMRAAFTVAQAVARGQVQAGRGGAIVNIGSTNGHITRVTTAVYTMTKFAIEGMTKALALELGPHGIRVNSVCPTFIETPLVRALTANPDFMTATLSHLPLGRIGQVEDLMGVIVFLASPAASLITGASLLVDAGQTVQ
jgi:NAD(P)-dependent dehydrogenase (short-subunit alcohol dehydrogenase family)